MQATIYESAHKGDFDFVRDKVDKDKSLITTKDSVNDWQESMS